MYEVQTLTNLSSYTYLSRKVKENIFQPEKCVIGLIIITIIHPGRKGSIAAAVTHARFVGCFSHSKMNL